MTSRNDKSKRARVTDALERRQEDSRGALTLGAWVFVETAGGDSFRIETCILSKACERDLQPLGFTYDDATGRFHGLITGEVGLRRAGAVLLALLGREATP